jgi:hypothetical protein
MGNTVNGEESLILTATVTITTSQRTDDNHILLGYLNADGEVHYANLNKFTLHQQREISDNPAEFIGLRAIIGYDANHPPHIERFLID